MVALKASDVERFVAAPDPRYEAVLVYGPDEGLVAERARRLCDTLARRDTPPSDILRLDDADLESSLDRLHVELGTVSMFSSGKVVRVTAGRRINAALLKSLLEDGAPKLAACLVVTAGPLRPDESLRGLFDKSPRAAALPCFADEARDLDAVVRTALSAAGLKISPDAKASLIAHLGADRGLTRAELDKLVLYAAGSSEITVEDVEAVVADATEVALDRLVFAAADGEPARAARELERALSAGEGPQSVMLALERHVLRLHRLRSLIDSGRSFEDAARLSRPPLPYKLKATLEAELRAWTRPRLDRALSRIDDAIRRSRLSAASEDLIVRDLVLALAGAGR